MIDWGIIGRIWMGYGVNIIVLVVLLLVVWVVGMIVQRFAVKNKANPRKG